MTLAATRFTSPVGVLTLVASAAGLVAVLWPEDDARRVPLERVEPAGDHPVLRTAGEQLRGYFAGERRVFDLPLDWRGSAFQMRVWMALLTIPYGETRSYGALAAQIGHPDAARAVGAANGRNPISIIAPCHRVIGSTGKLTGFAGGMAAKAQLLALERGTPTLPF